MEKQDYQRSRYFVRSHLQLRYIGLILAVGLLSAIISGYTIYYNLWVLLGDKLANVYPQGRLVSILRTVNIKVAINMFFVGLLCLGIGIVASNKMAGPIYRIIKYINDVLAGNDTKRLTLRKGDELTDLAEAINGLVDKTKTQKKS